MVYSYNYVGICTDTYTQFTFYMVYVYVGRDTAEAQKVFPRLSAPLGLTLTLGSIHLMLFGSSGENKGKDFWVSVQFAVVSCWDFGIENREDLDWGKGNCASARSGPCPCRVCSDKIKVRCVYPFDSTIPTALFPSLIPNS